MAGPAWVRENVSIRKETEPLEGPATVSSGTSVQSLIQESPEHDRAKNNRVPKWIGTRLRLRLSLAERPLFVLIGYSEASLSVPKSKFKSIESPAWTVTVFSRLISRPPTRLVTRTV